MHRWSIYLFLLAVILAAVPATAQTSRINSISPAQVQSGAASFPLVVKGSNFSKRSVVQLNGTGLDTYFVSWNKLRAIVPASLVSTAGNLSLRVVKNGRSSSAVNLGVISSPVGNYDWTALTARLQSYVPGTVSGLTMMISRHGRIIYSQAFGNQTVNTILPIASATKLPAMAAIMTLVDQGVLNLDAPITTYLNGLVTVPPDKAGITMRMLMNHTSGLSGTADAPCLDDRDTTLRLCAQQILNLALAYTPGTRFDYGGNGMQLAGYVAEVLAGESWNQFFARKMGTPLGLTRFTFTNTQNPRVPGGAFSDVGDYTRILQMYLANGTYGGNRIVSNQSYYEMQTDQRRGLTALNNPGGNRLTGYSYGWWHSDPAYLASQPSPQTPGLELSDQGAFGCTPWIDFEHNYTAIILVNSNVASANVIWNDIRPLIIAQMLANS